MKRFESNDLSEVSIGLMGVLALMLLFGSKGCAARIVSVSDATRPRKLCAAKRMSVLRFDNPAKLKIIDRNSVTVKLCDNSNVVLIFEAKDRIKARQLLSKMNRDEDAVTQRGPFRLVKFVD